MATQRRLAAVLLSAGLLLSTVTTSAAAAAGNNLAVGKPITASSTVGNFAAAKANDDDPTTYWEASPDSYPNTLTVALGANADITSVAFKLNPEWGARDQTVEVLGREQSASTFTTLSSATLYTLDPATQNTVTIPVTAKVADVQLKITANTGSGGGQIAEFQVFGEPAPNPDLTVSGISTSPTAPVETDDITASATIANIGTLASSAPTNVTFYLGTTKVATAQVGPVAAGAASIVSAKIGAHNAGAYQLVAKVDEAGQIFERDETNNSSAAGLTVQPVTSADLIAAPVTWTPDSPSAGDTVNFSVAIKNQGTVTTAGIVQIISLTVTDSDKRTAKFYGFHVGRIAPGATTNPIALGGWRTKANGKYTVTTTISNDANEVPIKRANNTSTQPLFVGRGASMPYDSYEAEDGTLGGGAAIIGPNRTIGDLAGEASGRKAVTLNSTGSSVEFTTRKPTNTLVARVSTPDSPTGGGLDTTLDVYVNGKFRKALPITSKYAWLYGPETNPGNSPSAGPARHIYDEANVLLGDTVPAGSKIKLVKSAANTSTYAVDLINLEQVKPIANPDPARYLTPAGYTQQDLQTALDKVRTDITGTLVGVYLPPGDYQNSSKVQVSGTVQVIGAGPWFTRFHAPQEADNTDAGFNILPAASGSTFSGFSYFGNYKTRIDGPGKVFDLTNVSNLTFDNLWVEHTVCMLWGTNVHGMTVQNSRIRNTFADALNLTNGSTDNHVINNEARATGDDSFALYAATDLGGGDQKDNVFEHLTALLPWRAAGIAVYGGHDNTFKDIYIADTLAGAGATISSLSFGVPMRDFGPQPTTLKNITITRAGGHFFGAQTFPAVWLFSATNLFQGIRVSNVDIVDPTYSGIMFQTMYTNGQPANSIKDTKFTEISITGAKRSGDEFDAKSGFAIWANELPEAGQGPAIGQADFKNLHLANNNVDIKNTTSTFTITR
jgi:hypothetical protein